MLRPGILLPVNRIQESCMTILGHIRTTVLIALTIILVAWGTTQAADTSIIFTPPETIVGDVGEQAVVYLALVGRGGEDEPTACPVT